MNDQLTSVEFHNAGVDSRIGLQELRLTANGEATTVLQTDALLYALNHPFAQETILAIANAHLAAARQYTKPLDE